jgi:hypothetical protein
MIPIKIQCSCGQHYAFEIEPVNGRMPSSVACPACGADGTDAANEIIGQSPITIAPAHTPLRVSTHAASTQAGAAAQPRRPTGVPQMNHEQALHEAKAKILWGDSPLQVKAYLASQGFSREEATELVDELFAERAATIRGNGIMKIITGACLICLPIAFYIVSMLIGILYLYPFAATIMAGIWGMWQVIKGISMLVAPKSEEGDVSEQ